MVIRTTREKQIRQYKMTAKKENKKLGKIIPIKKTGKVLAIALTIGCCACSNAGMHFQGSDYAQLSGSAEGIKEILKGMNGFVTTGKSAPNTIDSYWSNQDRETDVKRLKFPQPIKVGGQ